MRDKCVAIIPARGGSKRILNKNIRPFFGKPIISYSIRAAQESGLFDDVIVSTDCQKIAKIANDLGASTPFYRPEELSDDNTPLVPVVRHAISKVGISGGFICCILATAPFIQADDLKQSFQLLFESDGADFVIPVTTYPFPIQRAMKMENGFLDLVSPEFEITRSQDLEERFHDAGQFYWGRAEAFMNNQWFISRTLPYSVPRWRVQDIDTEEDWATAEKIFGLTLDTIADEYRGQ